MIKTTCINVWLDDTNGPEAWIVSIQEDGTNRTLSVHDDRAAAVEAGRKVARERKLPAFVQDKTR